jgi:protease I
MASTRRVLIITGPEFEDIELLYPYYRLMEAGFRVDIVSHPKYGFELTGKHGYKVKIDLTPEQVVPEHYDALILPGGKGPERVRIFKEIVNIVEWFLENNKPVAAICHGPQLLISASLRNPSLLRGRRVTSTPSIRDDLLAAGAEWIDAPVVVDGRLVTARLPPDIPAWMREFTRILGV